MIYRECQDTQRHFPLSVSILFQFSVTVLSLDLDLRMMNILFPVAAAIPGTSQPSASPLGGKS